MRSLYDEHDGNQLGRTMLNEVGRTTLPRKRRSIWPLVGLWVFFCAAAYVVSQFVRLAMS